MTRKLSRVCFVVLAAFLTAIAATPQEEAGWKVAPDEYVSYRIGGKVAVRHAGFFGSSIQDGRRLRDDPTHPALISLPLVMRLPSGPLKTGSAIKLNTVFSRFDYYTPVRVRGVIKITDAKDHLLSLQGRFKLRKVKPQGKDLRYYQIVGGTLDYEAEFNVLSGTLSRADVKFEYAYDERVSLGYIYSSQSAGRQKRDEPVTLNHRYRFAGKFPLSGFRKRVDRWVDRRAKKLRRAWAGARVNESAALDVAYEALYAIALLYAQVPKQSIVIQRAWTRIRNEPLHSTYAAALVLMLLETMNTPPIELAQPKQFRDHRPNRDLSADDKRLLDRALEYLIDGQRSGGWTYMGPNDDRQYFPDQTDNTSHDNSNTQFALMGLYAAHRLGARIDAKTWRRALGYWRRMLNSREYEPKGARRPIRGWAYQQSGAASYVSMTAGGIASLYIIAEGLGVKPGGPTRDGAEIGKLIREGRRWLDRYYNVRHATRAHPLPHAAHAADWAYQLYALERACDIGRIDKVAGRNWYREGAMAIVRHTVDTTHEQNHVHDALCLLFLRRSSPAARTVKPPPAPESPKKR